MKLTYRGQRYTTTSSASLDTIATDIELQFMGRMFKRRVPAAVPTKAPKRPMVYRGQSYMG